MLRVLLFLVFLSTVSSLSTAVSKSTSRNPLRRIKDSLTSAPRSEEVRLERSDSKGNIETFSSSLRSSPYTPNHFNLPTFPRSLRSLPSLTQDLKVGIAGFYDKSSKLWEDVWGDHLHHGYYIPEDRTDHKQAQVDMIEELLKFADTDPSKIDSIVDVGCGIGGSTRHLASKYSAFATGITLSPYQANRGNELVKERGLDTSKGEGGGGTSAWSANLLPSHITNSLLFVALLLAAACPSQFQSRLQTPSICPLRTILST